MLSDIIEPDRHYFERRQAEDKALQKRLARELATRFFCNGCLRWLTSRVVKRHKCPRVKIEEVWK